jgi:hypothetical protein
MMRMPARAEIDAAERRVVQSRQIAHDRLRGVRAAYRVTLARPSTLMMVMAVAGVAAFCLARPLRRASSSGVVGIATTSSVAGVVGAFILQYGMRHLPFFLRQVWTVWQARVARAAPDLSKASASA